jgi:hypothetical protein
MPLSALSISGCAGRRFCSVSVFPCSMCGNRTFGKLANIYFAWFLPNGDRSAVKARFCVDCYKTEYMPYGLAALESAESCPSCHSGVGSDVEPIYATVYLPGKDPREVLLPFCGPCSLRIRAQLYDRGQKLPNRESVGAGGPPPRQPLNAGWDDIEGALVPA